MILSVARDITARKQAEEAHRRKEKWYRRLFESHSDAIYLLADDGRILDANISATKALDRSFEEILSLNISDIDRNFDQNHLWNSGRTTLTSKYGFLKRHIAGPTVQHFPWK